MTYALGVYWGLAGIAAYQTGIPNLNLVGCLLFGGVIVPVKLLQIPLLLAHVLEYQLEQVELGRAAGLEESTNGD